MERERSLRSSKSYRAFVGTWNVHGTAPPTANLKTWLQGTLKRTKDGKTIQPDFYVIG